MFRAAEATRLLTMSDLFCSLLRRYVGMVTIMLNDYPMLKYVLVGLMGLFVLTNKEG